jgi:hypothetical protein
LRTIDDNCARSSRLTTINDGSIAASGDEPITLSGRHMKLRHRLRDRGLLVRAIVDDAEELRGIA